MTSPLRESKSDQHFRADQVLILWQHTFERDDRYVQSRSHLTELVLIVWSGRLKTIVWYDGSADLA